jgi:hypothetical protein
LTKPVTQQAGFVYCVGFRLGKDVLRRALRGTEHSEGSLQKALCSRRHEGALGGDAEVLASPQREALTGFTGVGAAGWHGLLALSPTKARFVGKECIKLDRAEEVMVAGCKEVAEDIL